MANLLNKLEELEVVEYPPKVALADLARPEGYLIESAKLITTKFGKACVIYKEKDGQRVHAFLPKRFGGSLSPEEVSELSNGTYSVVCEVLNGRVEKVKFSKRD